MEHRRPYTSNHAPDSLFSRRWQREINELTPLSCAALAEKTITMVINTPLRAISREVVRMMAQTLGAKSKGRVTDGFLPFEVVLPESI